MWVVLHHTAWVVVKAVVVDLKRIPLFNANFIRRSDFIKKFLVPKKYSHFNVINILHIQVYSTLFNFILLLFNFIILLLNFI